jgi:hypothetical protein
MYECMHARMLVYLATAASPNNPLGLFKNRGDLFFSLCRDVSASVLTAAEVSGSMSTDDLLCLHIHFDNNHWI